MTVDNDEQNLRNIVKGLEAAWNGGDSVAWAEFFAPLNESVSQYPPIQHSGSLSRNEEIHPRRLSSTATFGLITKFLHSSDNRRLDPEQYLGE